MHPLKPGTAKRAAQQNRAPRGWDVFEVDGGRLEIQREDDGPEDYIADDREANIAAVNDVANNEPGAADLVLRVLLQKHTETK